MKVFISWSGERSHAVAEALREWLPLVLQYVQPWVSDKDIAAGDRWALSIAGELENSSFGIICVTPENLGSEWVHFEAGALSKSMLDAKVIPLLFDLDLSDLGGPLSQFQSQKADEEGLTSILKAINNAAETKTADDIILKLVPTLWPQLQKCLEEIPKQAPSGKHGRKQSEVLEDLVSSVRGLNTRVGELGSGFKEVDFEERPHRQRHMPFDRIEHTILEMTRSKGENGLLIPLLSGLLRSRFPWLSELLLSTAAELHSASPIEAEQIRKFVLETVEFAMDGPHSDYMLVRSRKELMTIRHDLPHLIGHVFDLVIEDIRLRADFSREMEPKGGK